MIPTLAQICSLPSPLDEDLRQYAAAGWSSIELWLGKVEQFLEDRSVNDLRRLLDEHDLTPPVASFQGGLFSPDAAARQVAKEHFRRRIDMLCELGVKTLVLAADIGGPIQQADIDRTTDVLTEAARAAGAAGLRLALEFQARSALLNNLQTAAAMVADVGSPHLGLCLDVFHYGIGPSKHEDLGYLNADNLFHVQLSDIAGIARELAADGDRVLPGDGDLSISPIITRLKEINYSGAISIELMNPQLWTVSPRQFGEIALVSLEKILSQEEKDG